MKINKNIFICLLIVLMLFICINTSSASDTLDKNLTSDDAANLQGVNAADISQDKLSSSGDTFVVDGNGGGDYTTISDAVGNATGGETIFIKNGEYSETKKIDIGTKQLTIAGESQNGVILKSGDNDLFYTTSSVSSSLVICNLTFKDISMTGSRTPIFIGGNDNVNITNCIFDNCKSRYGALRIYTTGSVIVDNCKFLNIQSSTGSYSSAIDFGGSGTGDYILKNSIIDNSSIASTNTADYIFGVIYNEKNTGLVILDNVTICNSNCTSSSGLISTKGNMAIRNSKLVNNYIYRDLAIAGLFFVNGAKTLTIESTILVNNTEPNHILSANSNSAILNLNYNNIQNNSFKTAFCNPDTTYNLDYNYWGSNNAPEGVTVNNYAIYENGEFKLNNGDPLEKQIPDLSSKPTVLPEGTIYVSATGDDANNGSSEADAVATIARAVQIASVRENKTSTIYLLNGDYSTAEIDVTEINLTFIGQEKGKVVIHGTGKYIFDVYGDHLISKFENIDFTDSYSPSGNMGALRLYADYSNFTVNNCNFRNISAKYGAIDIQADYGTLNINNCIIDDVTGSASMSAIVYINGNGVFNFDNIEIKNCRLDENYASENPATYLRSVFYVASSSATVTLTNSKIRNNNGPIYGGVIESKSKLTITNTVISDNIVNTSLNGANGGEYLIWASHDNADISISNCIITNNTLTKNTIGLFYNQKGSINVEYSDISNNKADKFIGSTGTITANNNWWGVNDQPDSKVDKWVIMNIDVNDSDLSENNKIKFTIDFNHVKTSSGVVEELTGGEIPKDSYSIKLSAQNGEITPNTIVINKGQVKSQTFTVTEINDNITFTCGSDDITTITIVGIPPYMGIIYVNTTGDDNNEGSIDAPVATISKAVELANKGIGQIIINEGIYTENGFQVTGDLNVTGVGKVTIDANNEGRLFYMAYGDSANKIELHNLVLTNAKGYGAAVYSFANELILDNVTIVNTQADGYLIRSSGKLTIKDSYVANSMSGNVIDQSGNGDILINNTVFKDNSVVDSTSVYAVICLSSGSGNLVIEDTQFINNTARQGVIKGNYNYNINVKGSTFIDNTNTISNGAIYAAGSTLTVTDSIFINNKAAKDGGAIYIGWKTTATIDKSMFINNSVTGYGCYGDAIYNANKLTVTNSVLLTNSNKYLIYNEGDVASAKNNWWGTNDNPKNLVASGYDEDEYEDYPDVDVSNWATMSASYTPADASAGDVVTVTATFSNANLPDGINVTFTSTSGLNTVVSTVNAKASTTYTIDANDEAINATSSKAVVEMPVTQLTNIVTKDNFLSFFDASGNLLDTVTFDELIFKGEFDNVDYITIDRPITITGINAVLTNIAFIIAGDGVTLNNMTLVANSNLGNLIDIAGENAVISNMNISYTVSEAASVINVYAGANGAQILNNNIYFESTVDSYTMDDVTTAICVNSGISVFDDKDPIEGIVIDCNDINVVIPAFLADIYENEYYVMGLSAVNGVRINGAEKFKFTRNKLNVTTNRLDRTTPTFQALYVASSSGLIDGNDIYMIDTFTPEGKDVYLYAIELIKDEDLIISNNYFNLSTTGGKVDAGSAYAIIAIASDFEVNDNNITTVSNGPNLAIYFPSNMGSPCECSISGNIINVTGLSTNTKFGLVSGIEIQTGDIEIIDNTIYTYNIAEYAEANYIFGISYAQDGVTPEVKITDNTIYTEGHYAISFAELDDASITDNYLVSNDLIGDDSVFIGNGSGNTVKDNIPVPPAIVTNDTFYQFFDESGILKDGLSVDELIFKGEFSNLTNKIVINKAVKITGENAVLNNMGITIKSENVVVDNLTLIATASLGDLISVTESNVDLYNLDVSYIVGDVEAIAINVKGSKTLSDVNILNSTIYFESHLSSDEYYATAINLEDVEDVIVDGNTISASVPALFVETYDYTYFMMGLAYVNPIRIYEGDGVEFTNNNVDVTVNDCTASFPTTQALYIVGSEDVLIKGNNFTMIDTATPLGTSIYLYAVECGFSSDISFIENNFNISTTGGQSGAGSAYALQIATSDATIIGNNIACDSNGPNLGIFSPYGFGPAKNLIIKENFLNISGYAAGSGDFALISGIEIQTGYAVIYNNTIYVQNKGSYSDSYPVAAVSAAQYSASTLSFDIKDNDIYTNGKYAVDIRYTAQEVIVVGNYLVANTLEGDDAVYIKQAQNKVVKDNVPTNVVTNDTFYNFFDAQGVLLDSFHFNKLIFNGTFSNLTDKIVINKPITITGENAVLNNIAFKLSEDVKLSNVTLNANKEFASNDGALIYATGANIEINNVVVNYTAPSDVEAIGIYANAANNFVLSNSEIIYAATNPGDKHNYGLEVRESNNALIDNNVIDATLPAVPVSWGATGIDADLVLAVGIQGGNDIEFTNNRVNVATNGAVGSYPTIDAVMIHSANDILVKSNNISHIDTTTEDGARYYYSLDLYSLTGTIEGNNIIVNTTAGVDRAGTAYPIQLTGPYTVTVKNNNLTAISKGPTNAIYTSNWGGPATLFVEGNNIDVTGYATSGNYALVSGIEAEIDVLHVYNNTIVVKNGASYDDANQVYGISIASSYMTGDASADIKDNDITVDGKYAVYYAKAVNTNVTGNILFAHELSGDSAAVIGSGENNTIKLNFPPFDTEIIIDANDSWIGDVPIVVTVPYASGNVTIKVNEKVFKDIVLVDGSATIIVDASDLIAGVNNVVVNFTTADASIVQSGNANATFCVYDGIVTQDTYLQYFNQADNGKLFDYVPEGATLDFQGSIINPDQAITVQMNVNKPVNIISSTHDAYVDLNTTAGSLLGESPGNSFAITYGGSGSNVSGINFHNTQLWFSNTHHVVLDNISNVVEDQRVGSGVGATSIRDNSSYVILKNSYFYTRNNGGSTTFTMSWATYCTIDNCTVKAEGNVGNLIYLNIFNVAGAPTGVPLNNYNTVSNNRIYGKEGSAISVGLMVEGTHNLIVNNTLYKSSISTSFGGTNPSDNIYVGNTMTEGSGLTAHPNSIIYGNNVTGALSTGKDSVAYDNLVGGKLTVGERAIAYNNTVGNGLATGGINTIIENNTIVGAVTINKVGTTFTGNNVTGTVTVSANDNVIKENRITSTGDYAVDLGSKTGNNVTDNYLVANVYHGDIAVKYSNADNIVENNIPLVEISPVECGVWIGNNATITVNIANTTGSVTITINGKSQTVDLVDGVATAEFETEGLTGGKHNVTVTYNGPEYAPATINGTLVIMNGVITQDTYELYFNQADGGKLFDYVPEGVTLDFQGSIINPDQNILIWLNINKPVNVISSTKDAYIDLNTTAASLMGENPGNRFTVSYGGSGSNISDIRFHNTQLWIANTHHVVLDNISNVIEDQRVGSGVGATSVRENCTYVTVKNSYFYTRNNGGSSSLVMAWADYCTFDNNTIVVEGNVGNMIYLTTFNVNVPSGVVANVHNNITNNRIYSPNAASAICWALVLSGSDNLIENNTVQYKGVGITTQFGSSTSPNNIYRNNVLLNGSSMSVLPDSIVYNNYVSGALTVGARSVVYNNTVGGKMTVNEAAYSYNNTVGNGLTTGGTNTIIEDNTIVGAVTINKVGTTFIGNDVTGTVTVSANNNVIKENRITSTGQYAVDLGSKTGNNVTDNLLYAASRTGNDAVKHTSANNIVEHNYPPFYLDVIIDVNNVWIGNDNVVKVSVRNATGALGNGSINIKINNKTFTVALVDGEAQYTLSADDLIIGENEVVVEYLPNISLHNTTSNSTTFVVLNGVITNETYSLYFDASGNLVSLVPDNVVLDFQGLFLGKYPVYINKAVNVTSSTGDALFDAGATYAGNSINSFNMIAGADHSNITGLKFINYCLYIKGASYVTVDGISIVANKRGVGSGTGFLSIHTGAYYTTVKNGYFENGGTGSSLLVLGKGGAYAFFDHNIFNITGSSGNILSANQFVGAGDAPEHVSYTNNVLYNSQPGSAFCYAMTVSGSGNLLENNTIYHNGSGILNQYGATSSGNVYRNNTLYGNTNFNPSANSIVENNKIYATTNIAANTTVSGNTFTTVAISGTNTVFTNNIVNGAVTVSGNNNVIKNNNITSTGDYAVDLGTTSQNNVTDNYLAANSHYGDASVKYSGFNIVENNVPLVEINPVECASWIGYNATVSVNIANTTGSVTITINGKSQTVDLIDGVATAVIETDDLVVGKYNVTVTYNGPEYAPKTINGTLLVLDGVVTQENYLYYFNQADNGKLFDYVPEGATLDFQGSIINPDQAITVQINVNKPVNIISSTHDAYVDLNTTAGSLLGESPGNSFAITYGGSGSNVTGINFHNTQLWISNTHNVVLDNISVVVEDQRVGSGVGATSIRDNSSYVVLKNSYLYTRNNGGSTTFTMSWATYCTIDNCTVKAEGNVGNLIYLNTFNIVGAPSGVPLNNYNTVSNNRIYGKEGSAISVGLMVEGTNNLIVNNTLYKSSISTSFGATGPANNTYVGNTMTEGSGLTAQSYSIVYGNNVTGALTTGTGSVAYDNLVGGKLTVSANAIAYNNTVGNGLTTGGTNTIIEDNTIVGAVTINKVGTTFIGNDVTGTVTVSANNNVIKENRITSTGEYAVDLGSKTGNNVTDNLLYAASRSGNDAVKYTSANNIVEHNYPPFYLDVIIDVNNVWIGNDNVVKVSVRNSTGALGNGSINIKINNKTFTVALVDGEAQYTLSADDLIIGENEVVVEYLPAISLHNTTSNATTFVVLDGVITNETYSLYFDASGNLLSYVPNNVVLDFQGLFLGKYPVYINKAVNVTSSTGDAVFDAGVTFAGNAINSINIVAGGDHTNITGLKLINYCLYIKGASYVTVDGISIVANKRGVGSGTGFLSIHTGAYYTTVKNGYFENGGTGSSLLVLGKGGAYAFFDHNIFNITGSSGNILSANQYVGSGDAPEHVSYTNNVLYNSQPGSAFCYAMTVSGSGNLVENNTIYHNGSGILNQYGASSTGNVYRNNTIYGTATFNPSANSIVENNRVQGTTTIAAGTTATGNTFAAITISGTNVVFTNNNVTTTLKVTGSNNVIKNNNITSTGDYAVDLGSTSGNNVTFNRLVSASYEGDAAVKFNAENNNIVENNYRLKCIIVASAEDIVFGNNATINVSVNDIATGEVQIIINGKKYIAPIIDGVASIEVPDLGISTYTVTVSYGGDYNILPGENITTFAVSKKQSDAIITTTDLKVGEDVDVTVTIDGATGNITLIVDNSINNLELINGVATYTIESIKAGSHSITVIYGGDETHEYIINSTHFTLDKIASEIKVNSTVINYGETAEFDIIISPVTSATLLVNIGGNIQFVDAENGVAHVSISGLKVGNYSIKVSFAGDDYYDASANNTEKITVNSVDAGLKATSSNINVTQDVIINVEINPNATGSVTLRIGDAIYPVTLVDGKGSVVISNLPCGTYTAYVTFAGDAKYSAGEVTTTFTVSKIELPENITVSMDIPEGTTSPSFTINLPSDATGNFTVTVDGKNYTKALVNGSATVSVNDLTVGNHSVASSYSGDAKYDGFTSETQTVNIPKATIPGGDEALNVTVPEGSDSPSFSIKLPSDATGNLTVDVDGKVYSQALVNGSANITVPGLSQGDHKVNVTYTGDDKYDGVSKNTTVHVPVVKLSQNTNIAMDYSASATYKVLVTKDGVAAAGEQVTINFNGVNNNVVTDKNGYASLKIPVVKPGVYTIKATCTDKSVSNTVKVSSIIKASNKKVKKSKKVNKVKITLKKVDGKYLSSKTLTIKFAGKTYKVKTNKKGVATWKVKKSMIKKLKVNRKYTYSVTYGLDTVYKKLTIKK